MRARIAASIAWLGVISGCFDRITPLDPPIDRSLVVGVYEYRGDSFEVLVLRSDGYFTQEIIGRGGTRRSSGSWSLNAIGQSMMLNFSGLLDERGVDLGYRGTNLAKCAEDICFAHDDQEGYFRKRKSPATESRGE